MGRCSYLACHCNTMDHHKMALFTKVALRNKNFRLLYIASKPSKTKTLGKDRELYHFSNKIYVQCKNISRKCFKL